MSEPSWELLGGGGVLGPAGIDYIGAWAGGVSYQPGQIVTYNGVDYIACNPSTGQTPPFVPPFSRPAYGTSLPASPADGQEAVLVDSITNPTYQWRFRFNAGSTSAYKWEFIGGSPATAVSGGGQNVTSNDVYTLLTPTLTATRAGDYLVSYTCGWGVNPSAGLCVIQLGVSVGGVTPPLVSTLINTVAGSLYAVTTRVSYPLTLTAAGSVVQMCAYVNSIANMPTSARSIALQPVRVA